MTDPASLMDLRPLVFSVAEAEDIAQEEGTEIASPEAYMTAVATRLAIDHLLAFLVVLERLTPDERAVVLLREAFDCRVNSIVNPDKLTHLGYS